MAGPLSAAGGFCAGSDEVVEHQRLSAASYTFSAALPAISAVTASETLMMLQTQPDLFIQLKENIKAMWQQIDPRSDWVYCSSAVENPIMLLVLKPEVVSSRRLTMEDQQHLLQDIVDEVCPRPLRCALFCDPANHGLAVSFPKCFDHSCQDSARGTLGRKDRHLHPAPSSEGMSDHRSVEEGDREGRCDDSACHHEDHDEKAVMP
jgi:hypothetical protein